ncbi:MAG: MutH/Sau3AI family endonuclease [Armatimonadota bacterium]|nr:MutH/Sau3AI family endonuclease [Armatimonadota bacterium]
MDRTEATARLSQLIGADLRQMADYYGITVWKQEKINKGWAGHVIERCLGLPLNSSRAPNFGSWELKLISLKRTSGGNLKVKETMAITMIDPVEVMAKEFEESHLYNKLRKALIVARVFESCLEDHSIIHSVSDFDLDKHEVFELVKDDYNIVRQTLITSGFEALTGRMGKLVQPRTKGQGHGTTSRAFYARTHFVAHIIGLETHPLLNDPSI